MYTTSLLFFKSLPLENIDAGLFTQPNPFLPFDLHPSLGLHPPQAGISTFAMHLQVGPQALNIFLDTKTMRCSIASPVFEPSNTNSLTILRNPSPPPRGSSYTQISLAHFPSQRERPNMSSLFWTIILTSAGHCRSQTRKQVLSKMSLKSGLRRSRLKTSMSNSSERMVEENMKDPLPPILNL